LTPKQKYLSFCIEESLPVFVQPWYLDAICSTTHWDVALIERNEKVVAAFPYHFKKRGPYLIILMPFLVKMMGPYIAVDFQKKSKRITEELIEQLPPVDEFAQNFHYDVTDWLPFYWKGFKQSTMYSYVFEDLSDLDRTYAGIKSTYRNNKIKKAEKLVQIQTDLSLEEFYKIQQLTFARQGKQFVIPFSFLEKIDHALVANLSRKMFFAVDDAGRIHSVAYLIWDQKTAYYLFAGDDPNLRSSGAGIFLIWEAIQYTKNVLGLNRFDFQGSMIPGIEKVRRSFGAKAIPYFRIWKEAPKAYRLMKWLKGRGWKKS
jgi:hypothetical protein